MSVGPALRGLLKNSETDLIRLREDGTKLGFVGWPTEKGNL
jgi:hypothetical protein